MIWIAYLAYNAPVGAPLDHQALAVFVAVAGISAIAAYFGAIVFGIPVYVALRMQGLTAFLWAPLMGYVIGAGVISLLLIALRWDPDGALKIGGPLGAAVGAALWLIDRPDRRGLMDQEARKATRTAIAFVLAPLVVPLIWIAYSVGYDYWPAASRAEFLIKGAPLLFVVTAFNAYAGTFIVGAPVYLFLRARALTAFWIAPAIGLAVGTLVTAPISGMQLAATVVGPLGAAVGAVLWLIDRPDREPATQ
jgi:hypothetical protein